VVVFDLDETLILLNSLLSQSFQPVTCSATRRQAFPGRVPHLLELREQATQRERLARNLSEAVTLLYTRSFFGSELDEDVGACLSERGADSEAFAEAERCYLSGLRGVAADDAEFASFELLYSELDTFTQGWLSAGRAAVVAARDAGLEVALVSAGCLGATLTKLVLFQLSDLFAPERVFSSRRDGKAAIFASLASHFGPGTRFVSVGDGREEAAAALALRWGHIVVALQAVDGAVPPHLLSSELFERRLEDCEPTPGDAEGQDALPAGHGATKQTQRGRSEDEPRQPTAPMAT